MKFTPYPDVNEVTAPDFNFSLQVIPPKRGRDYPEVFVSDGLDEIHRFRGYSISHAIFDLLINNYGVYHTPEIIEKYCTDRFKLSPSAKTVRDTCNTMRGKITPVNIGVWGIDTLRYDQYGITRGLHGYVSLKDIYKGNARIGVNDIQRYDETTGLFSHTKWEHAKGIRGGKGVYDLRPLSMSILEYLAHKDRLDTTVKKSELADWLWGEKPPLVPSLQINKNIKWLNECLSHIYDNIVIINAGKSVQICTS